MSTREIESRLSALERAIATLQKRLPFDEAPLPDPMEQVHWWKKSAGLFQDDPDFKAAMRLGRKYRDSQNPYKKKRKKSKKDD